MPPISRKIDWSIPRPAGLSPLGTNGVRVPFPSIKRAALTVHNLVRRFFPTKDFYPVETSPTPVAQQVSHPTRVPYINPKWPQLPPVRGNPTIMATPGLFRKDT
jgi:hypothetical protein